MLWRAEKEESESDYKNKRKRLTGLNLELKFEKVSQVTHLSDVGQINQNEVNVGEGLSYQNTNCKINLGPSAVECGISK